jgi:DNA-binding transcriptional LysR family regulator
VDWNDLRYFLALARLGSVRAAGAALGVSHSTVVRRVDALESELRTRLFDRHRDGFVLTDAGERMMPAAVRVEDEVCALTRGAAGHDESLSGTVHLTCCDEYVAGQILEDLRPWCDQHPSVEIAVTTDSRPFNLAKGEADLAVRALPRDTTPPEYLAGRRLAPIVCVNFVGAAHVERLDPRGGAARWLTIEDRRQLEPLVREGSYPGLPMWGAFSSLHLLVRAAIEGLGLVILPTYVGDAEPGLVRLPEADARHVADIWLLYHPDLRDNARVQAVRGVIREGFERRIARYAGRRADAPQRSADAPG